MKHFHFQGLLEEGGWLEPAYISVDESGLISRVSSEAPAGEVEFVNGYAIPGFQNGHSHAFQYAMAGLAEYLRAPQDDFWSWREAMYKLALSITPEQMEAVATMLYTEMLRHGYTSVAEFHYLHHDPKGHAYGNLAEMGGRLMGAAQTAGIQLTLVPVYYHSGDFGKPALEQQRRFICADTESYHRLIAATREAAKGYDRVLVGHGIHSLRAAPAEDVRHIFAHTPPDTPFHIHIAEQQKEVAACKAFLGTSPVAWLADNIDLNKNCNLVHATHLESAERRVLAGSGAVAVICPSTEGNLGDGFFPLRDYLAEGGRIAIGSDSHIGLSPIEELRWLDYGQRLGLEKRNVVCHEEGEDSAETLFAGALDGGHLSLGTGTRTWLKPGAPLDALVLDAQEPLLANTGSARRLATYVYACDSRAHLGTLCGGTWVVRAGRHRHESSVREAFIKATRTLRS